MQQNIDPALMRRQIGSGGWQITLGLVLLGVAVLALMFGAGPAGFFVLGAANVLLFWGAMIRMFGILEAKLLLLIGTAHPDAVPAIPHDPEMQREIEKLRKA
jgi:hypothetical protein